MGMGTGQCCCGDEPVECGPCAGMDQPASVNLSISGVTGFYSFINGSRTLPFKEILGIEPGYELVVGDTVYSVGLCGTGRSGAPAGVWDASVKYFGSLVLATTSFGVTVLAAGCSPPLFSFNHFGATVTVTE
jgi:hypothetical protein